MVVVGGWVAADCLNVLVLVFSRSYPAAGGDQPAGDGQQPDPGEEHRLWGLWRPHGGLPEVLRHVRWGPRSTLSAAVFALR